MLQFSNVLLMNVYVCRVMVWGTALKRTEEKMVIIVYPGGVYCQKSCYMIQQFSSRNFFPDSLPSSMHSVSRTGKCEVLRTGFGSSIHSSLTALNTPLNILVRLQSCKRLAEGSVTPSTTADRQGGTLENCKGFPRGSST